MNARSEAKRSPISPKVGVCYEHRRFKRGACKECGVCIKCDSPSCLQGNRHNRATGRPRQSQNKASSSKQLNLPKTEAKKRYYPPLKSQSCKRVREGEEHPKKPVLLELLQLLSIPNPETCAQRFPDNGFQQIEKDELIRKRATLFLKKIINAVSLLLVEDECQAQYLQDQLHESCQSNKDEEITNALTKLSFYGNREVSIISQSVLASSMKRLDTKNFLEKAFSVLPVEKQSEINPIRRKMGKVKFASLRKTYNLLLMGKKIPKHDYTFRIDGAKLSALISFLQSSLKVRPGYSRDINLAGFLFKNMAFYGCGGKSVKTLYDEYVEVIDECERVGRDTFRDLVRLMTNRDEVKPGLSIYYIRIRDAINEFVLMMKRLCVFQIPDQIKKKSIELIDEWKDIQEFIMWSYSHNHLSILSSDKSHCCTCALGGECSINHGTKGCWKCINVFIFFDKTVMEYLEQVKKLVTNEDQIEIESMISALPKLTLILQQYMAHQLRSRAQFNAIEEVVEWLKGDSSRILVVIGHKQKVLPMKYCEGQIEYYRKKAMNVIGTNEIRWVVKDDGKMIFQHTFVNYVIKGYGRQDYILTAALLNELKQSIIDRRSCIKEICFQSNNASCFVSQELIPYIYHLNKETSTPIVCKWLFTEVQTGRDHLDTHFSHIDAMLKSYVEDGIDVQVEEDIVKALSYRGGIAGTTVHLIDCTDLKGPILEKSFKTTQVDSHETHEIVWYKESVGIIASSGITTPEVIGYNQLMNYPRRAIQTSSLYDFTSLKPDIFVDANISWKHSVNHDERVTPRSLAYRFAVDNAVAIEVIHSSNLSIRNQTIPPIITKAWAKYPANVSEIMSHDVLCKLRMLYQYGRSDKNRKMSADRTRQIIIDEIITYRWDDRVVLTIPRIKAFFQMKPEKQKNIMSAHVTLETMHDFDRLVLENEELVLQDEREILADSLLDIDSHD
ncbi:uncharacterized protein [Lepeophtheirus salmonis]|uniref:uncharacterized protein n=1 Tax=Lepeophtheirus salmonis TaxID=72036 RepID=UPI001AE9E52B|nr:uncharacterized protein LOC121114456 [Lepeophtheirus salmonis]